MVGGGRWEKTPEATQLRADSALAERVGGAQASAALVTPTARNALAARAAPGGGPRASSHSCRPPAPPLCRPADLSSPSPRDHSVSSGPRYSLLTHCITPLQCARPRAALFAFDLPIQLNYWHGELFSSVWGSMPGYRLPTHSRTNLASSYREGRLHRERESFPARMLAVPSGSGAAGAGTSPRLSGWNPGTRRPCCGAWRRRSAFSGKGVASGGGGGGDSGKAPELRSRSLAGSWAAAAEQSQILGETGGEERASASTQALLSGGEGPRGGPALSWAGPGVDASGLCELLIASGCNLRSPGGTEAIREPKEEARLTGSPEAVPAQRQVRSLARAPLTVVARFPEGCSKMR